MNNNIKNKCLTPCGHKFCYECLFEWLHTKTECPLCRFKLSYTHILEIILKYNPDFKMLHVKVPKSLKTLNLLKLII